MANLKMGSTIFAAAILGDVDAVSAQLSAEDPELLLSQCNVNGATVMHVAAIHGHTDIVKRLAHEHPRPQYVTERELHGRTSLHLAALNGKADVVAELLKLPQVDRMCRDHNMQTPLILAALNGHISVIIELLKGPKQLEQLSAVDGHGRTALHVALRGAQVETVWFLLKNLEVKQAIDQLTCKDHLGWTALHSAAGVGRAEIFEEIFNRCGASAINLIQLVNNTGWSPLHVASWLGHAEIVKTLHGNMGFFVNMPTNNLGRLTPLHLAAHNGHDAVVEDLLTRNNLQVGHCDALQRTALHYAARQGHASVVSKLLSTDSSLVNAADINGLTAIHLAAREGHEQVVCILLEEGANVNAKTESSRISESLLEDVLSRGKSSNSTTCETVLDPMILEADCWCISQMTPLHLAARNGHIAVVRQLLKCPEVDITALDGHGLMPQDWAEVRKVKKDFVVCLQQALRSAGETSARVPKKKLQILREEMMEWEKSVAVRLTRTSVQYMTEACQNFDKVGNGDKQDGNFCDPKASDNLEKGDTGGRNLHNSRSMNLHITPYDGLLQDIHEIVGQEELSDNTPLHVAVKNRHKKTVEVLVKCGPMDDINAKNLEGQTPLAVAFENNDVEICKLILQNSKKVEDDLTEMLNTAINRKWLDMGALLLGDARTRSINVDLLDEASPSAGGKFLGVLLRRTTIKEKLLQERKEHLDFAGAMLVIAALIAGSTYQGNLQPLEGGHHRWARLLFDWLNAIAFYSAVAATIAVASGSLPVRHMYELLEARDPMQISRGISCVLLSISSACVVWAYAAAAFSKAVDNKLLVIVNGVGTIATTLFLFWFLKHYIQLYKPFCRSSHGRSNGQHNGGYICTMCRTVAQLVQMLPSLFSRRQNDGLQHNLLSQNTERSTVAV